MNLSNKLLFLVLLICNLTLSFGGRDDQVNLNPNNENMEKEDNLNRIKRNVTNSPNANSAEKLLLGSNNININETLANLASSKSGNNPNSVEGLLASCQLTNLLLYQVLQQQQQRSPSNLLNNQLFGFSSLNNGFSFPNGNIQPFPVITPQNNLIIPNQQGILETLKTYVTTSSFLTTLTSTATITIPLLFGNKPIETTITRTKTYSMQTSEIMTLTSTIRNAYIQPSKVLENNIILATTSAAANTFIGDEDPLSSYRDDRLENGNINEESSDNDAEFSYPNPINSVSSSPLTPKNDESQQSDSESTVNAFTEKITTLNKRKEHLSKLKHSSKESSSNENKNGNGGRKLRKNKNKIRQQQQPQQQQQSELRNRHYPQQQQQPKPKKQQQQLPFQSSDQDYYYLNNNNNNQQNSPYGYASSNINYESVPQNDNYYNYGALSNSRYYSRRLKRNEENEELQQQQQGNFAYLKERPSYSLEPSFEDNSNNKEDNSYSPSTPTSQLRRRAINKNINENGYNNNNNNGNKCPPLLTKKEIVYSTVTETKTVTKLINPSPHNQQHSTNLRTRSRSRNSNQRRFSPSQRIYLTNE